MHHQGDLDGGGSNWAYVEGGMGMVSFAIADAAREAGAMLACGVPVARSLPARASSSRTARVIRGAGRDLERRPEGGAEAARRRRRSTRSTPPTGERLEAWDVRSPVVKFNAALDELPNWTAADGETWPARAMIELTDGIDSAQAAFERCVAGEPAVGFAEVYTQTGFDPSPAPAGKHSMTVFGQYAPYEIADGDWDSRRDEVARQFIDLIDRFAPGIEDRLIDYEVLGPPDIESRIGLTGGQIFQGAVLPEQMWENRLAPRTPMPGFYLCGAATHPGGSVIATNGRNAASRRPRRRPDPRSRPLRAPGGIAFGPSG